jgi:adenylate kinase family enzyme
MLAVAKEDLEALRRKNFKLIFVLGSSGTGKGTQCAKLVNELKYHHISTGDLIRDQIKRKTHLGELCESYTSKGELVPFELIINILVKAIITSNSKCYLIDGFPRSMEQALYFEKHIKQIGLILNIQANEEVCLMRIKSRAAQEKRADDMSEEVIKHRLREFREQSEPVIEFYQKFGVVRNINAELEVGQVFETVKEKLYPTLYLIIGKKYSGKTTLGNLLAQRMGLKTIDYKEFINSENISKKRNDEQFVLNSLINQLRQEESPRVLIEDFPLKRESYNYFVKNCKQFERVFYLNLDDNNASERMNKLGFTHPSYKGCSELNNQLFDFDSKKDVIDFMRQKTKMTEVNVNNHISLVFDNLLSHIAPSVLLFSHNQNEENSLTSMNELIEYFKSTLSYEIVNIPDVIHENIKRHTQLGKKIEQYQNDLQNVPLDLILEALKPVLFKEKNNKYILLNFPKNQDEISEFEKHVCKIQRLIYVSQSKHLPISDNSFELYMKKDNRMFVYKNSTIDEYVINDILGLNRDVTIAYGMPLSGKSTINNHLKTNYNYTMINFVDFIVELKRIKGNEQDPPQEAEATELTYPELLEGFKKYINSLPLNRKICLENIFGAPNELITEVDQVKKLFEITGKPRQFFEITCRDEVLMDRWKEVKGITEDVQEEQKAEFVETLDKPKKICEFLKSISYKTIPIDTNYSAFKSKMIFDANFGRNLIVIKHDYNLGIDNHLYLFAACKQMLVVNVPRLIYKQFYLNNEHARRLEDSYCKRQLNLEGGLNEELMIYNKYNPIHFDEGIVNELISEYILENSKEIEETGNFIILTGYLNNDLLSEGDKCFDLPLYEVKKLISLG